MLTGGQLGTEFATNFLSSFIAATLVFLTISSLGSFAKRVLFVATIGLSTGIAVNHAATECLPRKSSRIVMPRPGRSGISIMPSVTGKFSSPPGLIMFT